MEDRCSNCKHWKRHTLKQAIGCAMVGAGDCEKHEWSFIIHDNMCDDYESKYAVFTDENIHAAIDEWEEEDDE